MLLVGLWLALPTPALAQTTVTLIQGQNGYAGTTDAKIACCSYADANFGAGTFYALIPDDSTSLLIRFAIFQSEGGPVPNGASVTSATLSFYKYWGPATVFKVNRVLRNWNQSSVTWNTTHRSINTSYANDSWTIGSYQITLVRLLAFGLSLVALGLLYLLLNRTRFGRAVRATVQNPTSARLLGVDAGRVSALGFGLGTSTAAAAGAVYGVLYPFNPGSHYDLISRLLSIVVLGGLGSLGGAVVAALAMGAIEAVVAVEISPTWAAFSFFVVLIAFLLVRPQGIFGLRERTL